MAETRLERWLRPRVVFPLLAVLILVAIILSPAGGEGRMDTKLTTYGTSPYAAKGIYEVLGLLGWRVDRRRSPFARGMDTTATYVILDPPIDPSATEVTALLGAVRRGAAVLVSPTRGSTLADSFGIRRSTYFHADQDILPPEGDDSLGRATEALRMAAGRADAFKHYLLAVPTSETDTLPEFPADATTLLRMRTDSDAIKPVIMERRFGRGRALVISDLSFFRNASVRDTTAAILIVQLIKWLSPDQARPLVFDEYHQGYGDFTGPADVVARALLKTTVGRVATQVLIAGLVLLLAIGIRPIPPRAGRAIERRSPFEHVGALSRAYEQVHATRLATRRLVRGLRRRHPLGSTAAADAQYLTLLAERAPAAVSDTDLLRRALEHSLPASEWVGVGGAIEHIERTLSP